MMTNFEILCAQGRVSSINHRRTAPKKGVPTSFSPMIWFSEMGAKVAILALHIAFRGATRRGPPVRSEGRGRLSRLAPDEPLISTTALVTRTPSHGPSVRSGASLEQCSNSLLPFCYPTRLHCAVWTGTAQDTLAKFCRQFSTCWDRTEYEGTAAAELQNRCSTTELTRQEQRT